MGMMGDKTTKDEIRTEKFRPEPKFSICPSTKSALYMLQVGFDRGTQSPWGYRSTQTYGWEATAAPAATTSRDENFWVFLYIYVQLE